MLLKKNINIKTLPQIKNVETDVLLKLNTFSLFSKTMINLHCPTLFFIRVQRRYNKRRLAKARVYSRTSFFSSCSLGSIFLGLF